MTSKAERARIKKARGLPARRGRPLKAGPRHIGGKLKAEAIEPNALVVGARRIMLDAPNAKPSELRGAENPLDCALRRLWISPGEHRAGVMFAEIYSRAGLDLPKLRTQDIAREARGHSAGQGDARAMNDLRRIAEAMRAWPKATGAVFDMCVLDNWPPWMLARFMGAADARYEVGRVHLLTGLRIVGRLLGCDAVMRRAS